jgi:16S rRNA (guanine527-N7)-methyltransferase
MDAVRIAEFLQPFTEPRMVSSTVSAQLKSYLDLLLRWNARINLTAVREPEQIVIRHFGESLFAGQVLLGERNDAERSCTLTDVGSGAGFPGIPIKLFAPELELTLIESQNKKATFLREVIRTLALDRADVSCGRAEQWGRTADLVTLRAVEQFELALPVAAHLVAPSGRLCLLIGARQVSTVREILGANWICQEPIAVPLSAGRVVLVGSRR